MIKWDYLWTRIVTTADYDKMTKLGSVGWELVAVWDEIGFFKRPLEDEDTLSPAAQAIRDRIKEENTLGA